MATELIVRSLPIEDLPTPCGKSKRKRDLSRLDIQELLKIGRVRFAVADIGQPLRWINESACFDFWKDEASHHIAHPAGSHVSDFPREYCYFASEWCDGETPIVLLSKYH